MLFGLINGHAYAATNETRVTETIDYVYYDSLNDTYMIATVPDEDGGKWDLTIDNDDNETVETLNKLYKGKKIEIVFVGDLNSDEEIEIVSSNIAD